MLQVFFFSLIGGVFSLIGGLVLVRNSTSAKLLARYATPFAAGVLLAAAFVDLLAEALHIGSVSDRTVLLAALSGILGFFMLERFLRWFHHHHEHSQEKSANSLIIIGDTLHNALDGIAIGAAFLIDVPTGIVATAAVAAHEIPQEIGDFGLLLNNGMKKSKVILVNVVSALATTVTALLTFSIGDSNVLPVAVLLAITAGFFIYIAASDIIPEIHEQSATHRRDIRPWLLIFGALLVIIVSPILHDFIDVHEHHASEHEVSNMQQSNEDLHEHKDELGQELEDEHAHEIHEEEAHTE